MAAATIGRLIGGTMASMRMLRPAGYLANRAAGRWLFDVLLTLLAWAIAVVWASSPPYPNATHHPPGAGKIVVLALMVAPLVVRRIWPIPVFGVMVAAAIGAVLWDRRLVDGLALLIAVYTVAALRPRRAALVCAGLLEIAAVVLGVLFLGRAWWTSATFTTGQTALAAALGLGLNSAARRASRTRPDRPRDARRHGPPPDRHGHLERGGGRRVGQLAGTGRRGHARRVGDRAARAGRYPPAPRRAAPAPRRGPGRGAGAGARSHPARRADRGGPVRGPAGHAAGRRAGAGRARRGAADGVPARARGPDQHPQARRPRGPRHGAAAVCSRRTTSRHRR